MRAPLPNRPYRWLALYYDQLIDFHVNVFGHLVLCEFDALNHVTRKEDLARVARCVARAVRPGGYFYFDVNNRLAFEVVWPGAWFIERPGVALVMHGGYDRACGRGVTDCEWFLREGCPYAVKALRHFDCSHRSRLLRLEYSRRTAGISA